QRTLYSVEVEGTGAWGVTRVSPAFISVDQGEAGEVFVFSVENSALNALFSPVFDSFLAEYF
ncbi:hypothetical protein KKA72_00540, partial [Patescibacteria group bacterium]|nr:hypothetical protein [Patescibacteria group bacterium]MBU1876826.1 hypothetical protein [Patescibacteria group bacterium]